MSNKNLKTEEENNDIVVYRSRDGEVSFDVNVMGDTVWLTQSDMVKLFERDQSVIARHIRNIFKENELDKNSVYAKYAYTASDGKIYEVDHYSLDMVISVGYRVKSKRGIEFRQWANGILKQYLLNGYAINEHRITAIENKMDAFIESVQVRDSELKIGIQNIYKELSKIRKQSVVIHNHNYNQIQLGSEKLERKVIETLDEIIQSSKDSRLNNQLEEIKEDVQEIPSNHKAKIRLERFFKEIGDEGSDTNKAIKGAGIAKGIVSDLVKLLRDLISG